MRATSVWKEIINNLGAISFEVSAHLLELLPRVPYDMANPGDIVHFC